ncbi:MAG: F0F1 ATP synthase subunit epsilon [Gammaproteobacteria bacterium]
MRLKVLLPNEVYVDEDVLKVIAEAENGSFCLKPRHIDFVAALAPGLLSYVNGEGREVFLAVDEGTLVKCGGEVLVSTRNAIRGTELDALKNTVEEEFLKIDETERTARSALARLEAGVLRRYLEMRDELL